MNIFYKERYMKLIIIIIIIIIIKVIMTTIAGW